MGLTQKQQLFCEYYLGEAKGNIRKAARLAGYASSSDHAYKLLRAPAIRAFIDARLAPLALKTDGVLRLLSEQASASLSDFVSFGEDGAVRLDLEKAERRGKLHLVKKLTLRPDGTVSIELVDTQGALALLGKYHRLFTERVELAQTGPVEIRYVNDWR